MVNKISNPPPPGVSAEEHAKLLGKVQRVLDMFQVDDLDDILEAKEVDDNEGPEVEDVEVVPDGKEIYNGVDESESELPLDEEECRKVIELKKKLGDASAVLADDIHDLPPECEQFQEEMGVEEVGNMEELEDVEELASAEDINEPLVTRITKHDDNKHRRVDKESVVLRRTDENVNLPPPPPPGLFDDIRQESEIDLSSNTDDLLQHESENLRNLDEDIEMHVNELKGEEDDLEAEIEKVGVLNEMLEAQSNKLGSIRKSLASHSAQASNKQQVVDEHYKTIEELQSEKVHQLKIMREEAEAQEKEAVEFGNKLSSIAEMKKQEKEMKLAETNVPDDLIDDVEEMAEEEPEWNDSETEMVDKSKYNIYPLKKVINVKKIKNIWVSFKI